jgi:hypothetical protein
MTPAALARAHLLQELAPALDDIADRAAASAKRAPDALDRAYLLARAAEASSLAQRLRAAPGYTLP